MLVEGVRGPQGSQTELLREVDVKGRSQGPVEGVFPGHDELLSPTHENIPSEQASGLAELARKLCRASGGPMEILRGGDTGRQITR